MQDIICHQCNKITKFSKQLIGGEVRSCSDNHRGIYDSNLKFIRPAPDLSGELAKFQNQSQVPPTPPVPTLIDQDRFLPKSKQKTKNAMYDGPLCFSCQQPTCLIENSTPFNKKCRGCDGSGYYYDEAKAEEFICAGCDGDGVLTKKGEKRQCPNSHCAIYHKNEFVEVVPAN